VLTFAYSAASAEWTRRTSNGAKYRPVNDPFALATCSGLRGLRHAPGMPFLLSLRDDPK